MLSRRSSVSRGDMCVGAWNAASTKAELKCTFLSNFKAFLKVYLFLFICLRLLSACMYVYHVHAWCPWRPDEGVRSSRIEFACSCEPLCGCLELNHSLFARVASALFLWAVFSSHILFYILIATCGWQLLFLGNTDREHFHHCRKAPWDNASLDFFPSFKTMW